MWLRTVRTYVVVIKAMECETKLNEFLVIVNATFGLNDRAIHQFRAHFSFKQKALSA